WTDAPRTGVRGMRVGLTVVAGLDQPIRHMVLLAMLADADGVQRPHRTDGRRRGEESDAHLSEHSPARLDARGPRTSRAAGQPAVPVRPGDSPQSPRTGPPRRRPLPGAGLPCPRHAAG